MIDLEDSDWQIILDYPTLASLPPPQPSTLIFSFAGGIRACLNRGSSRVNWRASAQFLPTAQQLSFIPIFTRLTWRTR